MGFNFGKLFGGIGKAVGKDVLNYAGDAIGASGLGTDLIGGSGSKGNSTGGTSVANPKALAAAKAGAFGLAHVVDVGDDSPQRSTNGVTVGSSPILGSLMNMANGIGDFLGGRTHAEIDGNLGTGGRVADLYGNGKTSAIPTWAYFLGGGALLLLLLNSSGGRRR